jgi:glutathione reductase (NADPH)
MVKRYDLIVIGTGSAGATTAYKCNSGGWKTAIIDSRPFGGTCALRGCDPKKVLVGISEIIDRVQHMKGKGLTGEIGLSWQELMRFKKTFTDPVPKSREKSLSRAGIDAFHGRATFTGKTKLKVDDEELEARNVLIATGAWPAKLNIPGEEKITRSDQFLEVDNLPKRITFIGGGYISFEFAHIAARAGSEVRILNRSERVLKNFDPDLVKMLIKASFEAGIEIKTNTPVRSIEERSGEYLVHAGRDEDAVFEADMVGHGAGRTPELEDLHLEEAGVEYTQKGVVVNEYMQSVSNPAVYAAGDAATGGLPLTPVSVMEGGIVAKNLLEGNKTKADYTGIPSVVFTTPPLASVGLQEAEAEKEGLNFRVNYMDTSSWYSSKRIGLNHSGFKVLIENESNKLIGAHILGHNAEEVINLFAIAIRLNLNVDDIKKIILTYPTSSSDIKYMLD